MTEFRTIGNVQYSEAEMSGRGLNLDKNYEPEGNIGDTFSCVPQKKEEKKVPVKEKKQKATNEVTNQLVNDLIVEEFMIREDQFVSLLQTRAQNLIEQSKKEKKRERGKSIQLSLNDDPLFHTERTKTADSKISIEEGIPVMAVERVKNITEMSDSEKEKRTSFSVLEEIEKETLSSIFKEAIVFPRFVDILKKAFKEGRKSVMNDCFDLKKEIEIFISTHGILEETADDVYLDDMYLRGFLDLLSKGDLSAMYEVLPVQFKNEIPKKATEKTIELVFDVLHEKKLVSESDFEGNTAKINYPDGGLADIHLN